MKTVVPFKYGLGQQVQACVVSSGKTETFVVSVSEAIVHQRGRGQVRCYKVDLGDGRTAIVREEVDPRSEATSGFVVAPANEETTAPHPVEFGRGLGERISVRDETLSSQYRRSADRGKPDEFAEFSARIEQMKVGPDGIWYLVAWQRDSRLDETQRSRWIPEADARAESRRAAAAKV